MVKPEIFKNRAKELNMTQKDIADALGITVSAVSMKLAGLRSITSQEAERLAELLQIDVLSRSSTGDMRERLNRALLIFVERASNEKALPEEVAVLPEVARVLSDSLSVID